MLSNTDKGSETSRARKRRPRLRERSPYPSEDTPWHSPGNQYWDQQGSRHPVEVLMEAWRLYLAGSYQESRESGKEELKVESELKSEDDSRQRSHRRSTKAPVCLSHLTNSLVPMNSADLPAAGCWTGVWYPRRASSRETVTFQISSWTRLCAGDLGISPLGSSKPSIES